MLAHEREHARRRDPLVQWLAAFNRCIFWFNPLAWWLERRLAMLAEEVCDNAVVARGHDPQEYSEYLLHQARAIQLADARLPLAGSTMGQGSLSKRISRLLEARPTFELNRRRAAAATALCAFAITALTACQLGRVEQAAPGQPTMNELEHRQAALSKQYGDRWKEVMRRARALTPEEVQPLLAKLKANPEDQDTYWTLLRYYESKGIVKDRGALWLWYIEHHPGSKLLSGNINPQYDPEGYVRGKALWQAHLKRPGATAEIYQRAADFLEGGDRQLAESVLRDGQKAYPADPRWASALGRHYARALLGFGETTPEQRALRTVSAQEAQSSYVRDVRLRLAESNDASVLALTARELLIWSRRPRTDGENADLDAQRLARTYVERALSIEPESKAANVMKALIAESERDLRAVELMKMSPTELEGITDTDRILLILSQLRRPWMQKPEEAEAKARELLDLAARNQSTALYGDAVFEANLILGKTALRRGEKRAAARYLIEAAGTPGSDRIWRGNIEMNLPRALVDWGERSVAAEFLERMAPKTVRSKELLGCAAEIRKGVNPDLRPTMSYMGCTQGPC